MFTDYDSVVDYLYNSVPLYQQQGAAAYKPGLQTTEALDRYLHEPHRHYPTIHVAGTNGKGSTCHTLAAIYQAAGYKTGLYTSPHLIDMRERIRVNGKMIPRQKVIDFINNHRAFYEPLRPSFFELVTAMAFDYFAEEGVDIAIIETGLGGRLDCTNIITPQISIITNVSLDHTQHLGDTLSQIAAEKAGIMKSRVPAVVGEVIPQTRSVFKKKAAETDSRLIFAEEAPEITEYELTDAPGENRQYYRYQTLHYGTVLGELTGTCQPKNANTILVALRELEHSQSSLAVTADAVRQGFGNCCSMTGLAGRWQTLSLYPQVICDTGHNSGGWEYLSRQLSELARRDANLYVVFGMSADKAADEILSHMPPAARYVWTEAAVKRAMPADKLSALATQNGLSGCTIKNVAEAIRYVLDKAKPDDVIFIGGSTFVVAEAMPMFCRKVEDK